VCSPLTVCRHSKYVCWPNLSCLSTSILLTYDGLYIFHYVVYNYYYICKFRGYSYQHFLTWIHVRLVESCLLSNKFVIRSRMVCALLQYMQRPCAVGNYFLCQHTQFPNRHAFRLHQVWHATFLGVEICGRNVVFRCSVSPSNIFWMSYLCLMLIRWYPLTLQLCTLTLQLCRLFLGFRASTGAVLHLLAQLQIRCEWCIHFSMLITSCYFVLANFFEAKLCENRLMLHCISNALLSL
jgi:hypothetical protein